MPEQLKASRSLYTRRMGENRTYAVRSFVCEGCGKTCTGHYKRDRRYCSRACFLTKPRKRDHDQCSVNGCDRLVMARGLCPTHYERSRQGDERLEIEERVTRLVACSVEGCDDAKIIARGLCATHYRQWHAQHGARCSVEGCEQVALALGYCGTHRARIRAHGEPIAEIAIGDLGRDGGRIGEGRARESVARSLVAREVGAGRLRRSEHCERCGKRAKRMEAHHEDYDKPLDVEWLCVACHRAHHFLWLPVEAIRRLDAIAAARGLTRGDALLWMLEVTNV